MNTKIIAYVNPLRIDAKANDGMSAFKANIIEICETSNSFYSCHLCGVIHKHKCYKMMQRMKPSKTKMVRK